MNELQKKYGNRTGQCSLQLFGFPCNQFGYQEPAENHELLNCIKYVRPGFGYEPLFPLAKKGDVNGMYEHAIYTFLKARCPSPMGLIANRTDITWQPIRNNDISWNFQKWLIKHDGQPFKRYTSRTTPQAIEDDIVQLLNECTDATKPQQAEANAVPQAVQQSPQANSVPQAVQQSPQANAVPQQQQTPQANAYPQKQPQASPAQQRPAAGAQAQPQTVGLEHSPQQPSADSVALEAQPKPNAFVQPPAPVNQTQPQPQAPAGRKKRSLHPRH